MSDAFIQLPADGVGKKTRTHELDVSGNNVHQQVVELADDFGNLIIPASQSTQVANNALLLEIKNQNDLLRQLLILGAGLQSLNNVDTGGRQYVGVGSIASGMTLATVTTIGSLNNLSGVLPSSNIVNELNVQSFQSIRNNINVY
jgi:hypothetical protein